MQKNSFTYEELIACGKGELFGEGNAKLPTINVDVRQNYKN